MIAYHTPSFSKNLSPSRTSRTGKPEDGEPSKGASKKEALRLGRELLAKQAAAAGGSTAPIAAAGWTPIRPRGDTG